MRMAGSVWYAYRMGKKLHRNRVLAIREQYELGISVQEIADGYGYHRNTISDIVNFVTHKRVKPGNAPPFPVDEQTAQERAKQAAEFVRKTRRKH